MESARDASPASTSQSLDIGAFAGIAVAGLFITLCIACFIRCFRRARKKHQRSMADLENRSLSLRRPSIAEIHDPARGTARRVLSRGKLVPYSEESSAWDSLDSQITQNFANPQWEDMADPPKPSSHVHLLWPFSRRARHSRKTRLETRLSDIPEAYTESPRSLKAVAPMPIIPDPDIEQEGPDPCEHLGCCQARESMTDDGQPRPLSNVLRAGSPDLDSVASPALRPAPLFNDEELPVSSKFKDCRSMSLASLPAALDDGEGKNSKRPRMHSRSVSLCSASAGVVPQTPVPPLPTRLNPEAGRPGLLGAVNFLERQRSTSRSRASISSLDSGGSSVLIPSPRPVNKRDHEAGFFEDVRLQWTNSSLAGSSRMSEPRFKSVSPGSIRNVTSHGSVQCSTALSRSDNRLSRSSSLESSLNSRNRLSVGNVATADTIRMNRISSTSSAGNGTGMAVQIFTTPRRISRFFVDDNGSPSDRSSSILQDISGSSATPSPKASKLLIRRSVSHDTLSNVFRFEPTQMPEQSQAKPSALKGSPTARKGHRRQHCVRISLAPTILGPGSQNSSPSNMGRIREESTEPSSGDRGHLSSSPPAQRPHLPVATVSEDNVLVGCTSLRASLTPTSPTLSLINFCQENGLALVNFEVANATLDRNSTALSNRSSRLSIPSFPAPRKGRLAEHLQTEADTAINAPIVAPDNSADDGEAADDVFEDARTGLTPVEPVATEKSVEERLKEMFLSLSSDDDKNTVLPSVEVPLTSSDPPSSPPSLPSATGHENNKPISPRHLASSPTCSARTAAPPQDRSDLFPTTESDVPAARDPVKSEPLSNSHMPESAIPEAPASRSRIPTLLGPRAQPPKALRNHVQRLRRMNSDIEEAVRAERKYLQLGTRGASPGLSGGEWRDSYADLNSCEPSVIGFGNTLQVPQKMKQGRIGSFASFGEGTEVDVDEMLGIENDISLGWLGSSDTEDEVDWKRDGTGTPRLGRAESDGGGVGSDVYNNHTGKNSRSSSSVCDEGEKFWEENKATIPCPPSPHPAFATIPGLAPPAQTSPSCDQYIPGLTRAQNPEQPSRRLPSPPRSPPKASGATNAARAGRPERAVDMRRSAILNNSMAKPSNIPVLNASTSGQNRLPSVGRTTFFKHENQRNSTTDEKTKTPAPEFRVTIDSPREGGDVNMETLYSDASLYDEDGFLRSGR